MFLQLVAHIGGRYGSEGSAGWSVSFSPTPARRCRKEEELRLQAPRSGPGESPLQARTCTRGLTSVTPNSPPPRGLFGDLESDGTTQALFILFTGIGGVVTLRPALVPRVPGLTAAQLVAKEGTGARWGGGRDLAVPSLVSKLAPALLNAQPGALSDAGQQVRFPLAQLLLPAVQRQVGAAQFLRNPKGGDAQPPVRHGRP